MPKFKKCLCGINFPLSIKEARSIQDAHLKEWRRVLNAASYERLRKKVKEHNTALSVMSASHCGHDVWRGDTLLRLVSGIRKNS